MISPTEMSAVAHRAGSLIIRADASAGMGSGHVMRCLALAQAWRRSGGEATFLQASNTPALQQRLAREGFSVVRCDAVPGSDLDAAKTLELAQRHEPWWIIADGYGFGAPWQYQIKQSGRRLLLWDDNGHAEHYYADLVVNQNLGAQPDLYTQRESQTRLLLGSRYVQLRRDFLPWHSWVREIPTLARKVLITLGGSDPDNVTTKVLQALEPLADLELLVVAGGSNPHQDALKDAIQQGKGSSRLVIDARNMPELMAWADVAVAASGSTAWELAYMGLPSLLLVLADNQVRISAELQKEGVSLSLGRSECLQAEDLQQVLRSLTANPQLQAQMSRRGRQLVDGLGGDRLVTQLSSALLSVRRATPDDCRRVWEWANDPEVRQVSFSSDPIPWAGHRSWYAAKIAGDDCRFYIGLDAQGQPIGQIRYDLCGEEAVVSISLASGARGKGLGSALIVRGCEQLFRESSVKLVRAHIKPDNLASIRAFERAGFREAGWVTLGAGPARRFVLERV